MLVELDVRRFALLEDVRVSFGPCLNVFTGETGAGKSLLVDALEFLLGYASYPGSVVQGIFKPSKEAAIFLQQEGFDTDELYLSRESKEGGKSLFRINGILVPSAKVKSLAPYLLEIQGQNAHQLLLDPRSHLFFLDAFGGSKVLALREEIEKLYKIFREMQKELEALKALESQQEREVDRCRYEIQEIEQARFSPGEEEALRQEKEKLSHIAKLQQIFSELTHWADTISFSKMASHLQTLAEFEKKLQPWVLKLEEWGYEWLEFKEDLSRCREVFLPDPIRLEMVLERLDLLQRLKRKYGSTIEEILAYSASQKEKLASLENVEQNLVEVQKKLENTRQRLEDLCLQISERRKKLVHDLKKEVEKEFSFLAFPHGRFEVCLEPLSDFSPFGKETAQFFIALNPGQSFKPIKETASGGELSRIMLALRTVLASDATPTLVFDEVDAGLGGETAFHVAERLKRLSEKKQVLCVTHLHQVASLADKHFRVEKRTADNGVLISVKLLEEEEKVEELARMMGGERTTKALFEHARQLLASAQSQSKIKKSP
jgi:DNA repair protein RecN (Recombination protein N)